MPEYAFKVLVQRAGMVGSDSVTEPPTCVAQVLRSMIGRTQPCSSAPLERVLWF